MNWLSRFICITWGQTDYSADLRQAVAGVDCSEYKVRDACFSVFLYHSFFLITGVVKSNMVIKKVTMA
jgi:hypothetical protein